MKKVFLYAYDRINLGDDLFIHTIVKRYPNVQFYLWTSKDNEQTFRILRNLKVIDHNSRFLKVLGKIRTSLPVRYKAGLEEKCDVVVYIGGSLFIEYDNWENILNWWEYESDNRSFYVIGANFGPYKNEAYRERLNIIFGKMKDVCFRDKYSYQKFKTNKTVRSASDILFSYDMPAVNAVKKRIFISVINLLSKDEGSNKLSIYDEKYIDIMVQIIKEYLDEGYSIVLSSFCKYEGDEDAIEKILRSLDSNLKRDIQVLNYNGTNVDEILLSIAESEAVIASRFHAIILGILAGKPVYPIAYSDKTIHVLEDMNFQSEYVDIRNIDDFDFDKVRRYLNNVPVYPIKELRESAQKHFEKLDEVLKE